MLFWLSIWTLHIPRKNQVLAHDIKELNKPCSKGNESQRQFLGHLVHIPVYEKYKKFGLFE